MSKDMILYDSPEAAVPATVTGWLAADGSFYIGEHGEHGARYSSCTHRPCTKCGKITDKRRTLCDECRELACVERYSAQPVAEWNGRDMLYSEVAERWFVDLDELADYCADNETTPGALRIVIGEPVFAREIDPDEHYSEDMPDDGGSLPVEIKEAFAHLNKVINACKEPLSWTAGKCAASPESVDIGGV